MFLVTNQHHNVSRLLILITQCFAVSICLSAVPAVGEPSQSCEHAIGCDFFIAYL
jgi:hypothetical protein